MWTWNAIGKAPGAWNLATDANEARRGFLLNHLISDTLPEGDDGHVSNSDPVTGQAAWYDVRVRVTRADKPRKGDTEPRFAPMKPLPGTTPWTQPWLLWTGGRREKQP